MKGSLIRKGDVNQQPDSLLDNDLFLYCYDALPRILYTETGWHIKSVTLWIILFGVGVFDTIIK